RKETKVPHTEPQTEEKVPTTSNDPLPSGEDRIKLTELMNLCTTLQKQEIMNEEEMLRVNDFDSDEVIMDATAGEEDELTLAQTLIKIKAAKPKAKWVIVQEPSEFRTTSSSQPSQLPQAKYKEVARNLEAEMKAEMKEEERIAREKDEANMDMIEQWDEVQAKTDADIELAQKLQTKEQEQLTDAEKARLFMELLEKKRKLFARKREIEKRNRPPIKAQQRNLMCTYLKNMDR
nr:hypothetical protein [Tanacetum cinerariifolium]